MFGTRSSRERQTGPQLRPPSREASLPLAGRCAFPPRSGGPGTRAQQRARPPRPQGLFPSFPVAAPARPGREQPQQHPSHSALSTAPLPPVLNPEPLPRCRPWDRLASVPGSLPSPLPSRAVCNSSLVVCVKVRLQGA